MSFEDDMIEDGFHDEQDYLDYLCEKAEMRRERMNDSVHNLDDYYEKPSHSNMDKRTRRRLMIKCSNGCFVSNYHISKRFGAEPLKAGHFVRGVQFDYIDNDNAIIIPEQYDQVDYFREGVARCHKGCRWVLINESCEELPISEDESVERDFEWEGKRFFLVERRDHLLSLQIVGEGLMDEKGNVLLPSIFKYIHEHSDCIEILYDTNTFNVSGIKRFTYDKLLSIVNGPSGILDWENDSWPVEIIPFVNGVRAIRKSEKWGFEKENGEMLVDCQYTAVQHFREYYDHCFYWEKEIKPRTRLLAIVENGWCSGCIDIAGEIVFHIRRHVQLSSIEVKEHSQSVNYLWAEYYNPKYGDLIDHGSAKVQVDGSMIIHGINVPSRYDWGLESGDFIDVIKDDLWGIIDNSGKEIIPCKYDELLFDYTIDDYVNNRLYVLKKNGKYGKVNNKGEEVVPFIYDDYDSLPKD